MSNKDSVCPIRARTSMSFVFPVKAVLTGRGLVELLLLSLGKFHRHQLLSALARPAQGALPVFPRESQRPHRLASNTAGRALSRLLLRAHRTPAGRTAPGVPRRATGAPPGCSGHRGASQPHRAGAPAAGGTKRRARRLWLPLLARLPAPGSAAVAWAAPAARRLSVCL